jgi:hypothetical protein
MFADQPWESPWAPLGAKRIAVSFAGAAMLILTFMPAPFLGGGLWHTLVQYFGAASVR